MLWWAYICNSFTIALSVSPEGKKSLLLNNKPFQGNNIKGISFSEKLRGGLTANLNNIHHQSHLDWKKGCRSNVEEKTALTIFTYAALLDTERLKNSRHVTWAFLNRKVVTSQFMAERGFTKNITEKRVQKHIWMRRILKDKFICRATHWKKCSILKNAVFCPAMCSSKFVFPCEEAFFLLL